MISVQYFAMIYIVSVASDAIAIIVLKKFLIRLIYILGTPLYAVAFPDQSHTHYLGQSHL